MIITRATKKQKTEPVGVVTRQQEVKKNKEDVVAYPQGKFSSCSLLACINSICNSTALQNIFQELHNLRYAKAFKPPDPLDTPGQIIAPYLENKSPSTVIPKAYNTRAATQPIEKKRLCDVEDDGITPSDALAKVMTHHGVETLIFNTPGDAIKPHDHLTLVESIQKEMSTLISGACVGKLGVHCFNSLISGDNGIFMLPTVIAFETTMQQDGQVRGISDTLEFSVQLTNTYRFSYRLAAAIAVVNVIEGEYSEQHEQHAIGCILKNGIPMILNSWPIPDENVIVHDWRTTLIENSTSFGTLKSDPELAPIFPIYVIEKMQLSLEDSPKIHTQHIFEDIWPPAPPAKTIGGCSAPFYLWSIEGKHIVLREYPSRPKNKNLNHI